MASADGPSPSPACRGLRSMLRRRRADVPSSDQAPLISSSPPPAAGKKKSSTFATFCRLGCAFPAVLSLSDLEGERLKTEKAKKKKKKKERRGQTSSSATTVSASEVWRALGISFVSGDESMAYAASHRGIIGRGGRHDEERALLEIIFHHRILLQGGNGYDQYKDWRLDVDNMTYEELLELGEKIGNVSTGLRDEDIACNIRKVQHSNFDIQFSPEMERKCSICQEEYGVDDELGELGCGHSFHLYCIRNWLLQKNACPICKNAVV